MLTKILKTQREVNTGKFGDVVQLISLPKKKVAMLNNQGHLMLYDLYKVTIDRYNLKSKVYKIFPYTDHQIIVLSICNKSVEIYNLKTQHKYHLASIPSNKIGDNYKDSQIFFQTKVNVFKNTQHICLQEVITHQTNLHVVLSGKITPLKHALHNTNIIMQKYNQNSKLVLYKQDLQNLNKFSYQILDIENQFQQIKVQLDLSSILNQSENTLVTMVKQLSETQILIFLNNDEPGLFIYNFTNDSYQKIELGIQACLEEVILFDPYDTNYLMISYLGRDQNNKTTIDIIDIKSKRLVQRLKQEAQNLVGGWQNNFIINEKSSDQSSVQKFWIRSVVKKSSLIMYLLMKSGIMKTFGNSMCRRVVQLNRSIS